MQVFINHEDAILKGTFEVALLDKSRYKAQIEDIINLSVRNIYQSKEVIQKELLVIGDYSFTRIFHPCSGSKMGGKFKYF